MKDVLQPKASQDKYLQPRFRELTPELMQYIMETGTRLEEYGSCGKTCYSAAIRAKKIQQNAKPNRLGKKRRRKGEKIHQSSLQPGANSKKPQPTTLQARTEGRWEREMKKREGGGRKEDGGEKCSPN
jgi:hypothetical protein